jgi:hypothetical protein
MEIITGIANLLQTYGAWGLVSILLVVIYYQWKAYVAVRDKNEGSFTEQAKSTIALVEEGTTASVEHRNAIDRVAVALIALERRMENVEKKLG